MNHRNVIPANGISLVAVTTPLPWAIPLSHPLAEAFQSNRDNRDANQESEQTARRSRCRQLMQAGPGSGCGHFGWGHRDIVSERP